MTFIDFTATIGILFCRYDFSVTSWLRSVAHNAKVGGNSHSRHLLGLAVDVVLDDPEMTDDLVAEARRQGLIAVPEGDHVHLQVP